VDSNKLREVFLMKKFNTLVILVLVLSMIACSSISVSKIQPSGDLTGYILLKDGKKISFEKAFVSVDGKLIRINSTLVRQTVLMENVASVCLGKDKTKK